MPFILVLLCVNLFALLSPFLLIAAVFWGTVDDQQFMRVAFWVVSPLTVYLWYVCLRCFTAFCRGFLESWRAHETYDTGATRRTDQRPFLVRS